MASAYSDLARVLFSNEDRGLRGQARGEVRSTPQPPAPGRRPHRGGGGGGGSGRNRDGLRMIDDDLGMTGDPFPALPDAAPAAAAAAADDDAEDCGFGGHLSDAVQRHVLRICLSCAPQAPVLLAGRIDQGHVSCFKSGASGWCHWL